MSNRVKINSLYLYKKTGSERNALGFLEKLNKEREGATAEQKAMQEDMSTIHRRMYLAGMFIEMLNPQLAQALANGIDEDSVSIDKLLLAAEYAGLDTGLKAMLSAGPVKIAEVPLPKAQPKVEHEGEPEKNTQGKDIRSNVVGAQSIKAKKPF